VRERVRERLHEDMETDVRRRAHDIEAMIKEEGMFPRPPWLDPSEDIGLCIVEQHGAFGRRRYEITVSRWNRESPRWSGKERTAVVDFSLFNDVREGVWKKTFAAIDACVRGLKPYKMPPDGWVKFGRVGR
jgi:hypothetical protein